MLNYAVTITVDYVGATENMYQKTLLKYDQLIPIKVKNINEVIVKYHAV